MFRLLFRLRSNSRLRHNDWTAIVRRPASFPLSTRWRRVPKNSSYRQILKKGSLEQRRNTSTAGQGLPARSPRFWRWTYYVSAHFLFPGDFSPFYDFWYDRARAVRGVSLQA